MPMYACCRLSFDVLCRAYYYIASAGDEVSCYCDSPSIPMHYNLRSVSLVINNCL